MRSAVPLVKGVACADCWPHVDKFRVRNATPTASIEAVRNGEKCLVDELIDSESDFEKNSLDDDFIRTPPLLRAKGHRLGLLDAPYAYQKA